MSFNANEVVKIFMIFEKESINKECLYLLNSCSAISSDKNVIYIQILFENEQGRISKWVGESKAEEISLKFYLPGMGPVLIHK